MKQETFPHGATVRERITEFEGVIIGDAVFLNGCVHYTVQPRGLKADGSPHDDRAIPANMLLPKPEIELVLFDAPPPHFPLGKKVRCRYSGFSGISYGSHRWAHGAQRVAVLPGRILDKAPVEMKWFDVDDLIFDDTVELRGPYGAEPEATPAQKSIGGPARFDRP